MMSSSYIAAFDDLSSNEKAGVAWGFFWRAIIVGIASTVGGAIAGGILGFCLGLAGHFLGWSPDTVKLVGGILGGTAGLVIGVSMFLQYIKWLFRTKWSGYQLRLVKAE